MESIDISSSSEQESLENRLEGGLNTLMVYTTYHYSDHDKLADEATKLFMAENNSLNFNEIYSSIKFASYAHAGQWRKSPNADNSSPNAYILHPLQVGYMLALNQSSQELVKGGLFHDVIDNNPDKLIEYGQHIWKNHGDLPFRYAIAMTQITKPSQNLEEKARIKIQTLEEIEKQYNAPYLTFLGVNDNIANYRSSPYLGHKETKHAWVVQTEFRQGIENHILPKAREFDKIYSHPMKLAPYIEKQLGY